MAKYWRPLASGMSRPLSVKEECADLTSQKAKVNTPAQIFLITLPHTPICP